jgi:hypothetical protein
MIKQAATGKEARPPELDTFAAAFAVAGEEQEKGADQETLALLNDSRAILTLRRRRWNPWMLKKSKSDSIAILMGWTSLFSFTNHILCLFVGPQSQEDRLTQLVIECPLGKLDLSDEYGSDPLATFHDRRCDP